MFLFEGVPAAEPEPDDYADDLMNQAPILPAEEQPMTGENEE